MRLTRKDVVATLFVAAAALTYVLWQTGTALTSASTRAIAVAVFGFGWLACTSDAKGVADAYQPATGRRPSMPFIVVASLAGFVALVSGIVAIVVASETMLGILVAAMVVLWVMASARHVLPTEAHAYAHPGARTT